MFFGIMVFWCCGFVVHSGRTTPSGPTAMCYEVVVWFSGEGACAKKTMGTPWNNASPYLRHSKG